MSNKRTNLAALVECAIMVAVGIILMQIKIIDMPFGGSVTLASMLPFVIVSFRRGIKWGLLAGVVNAALQMIFSFPPPPSATFLSFVGVILLDYVLAFCALAFACCFTKIFRSRVFSAAVGTVTVCAARFLCSFFSGVLIWGSYQSYYDWAKGMSVWLYSFIYNGSYMLPETVITTVAIILIARFYPKLIERQK